MPKLLTNEDFLTSLKNHVDSRNTVMQKEVETTSDNTVIPSSLPDELKDWLAQIALLYGVPFDNLIPNESLFPKESIRFFYLDENWINSLIDGALSIGATSSKDVSLQVVEQPTIKKETQAKRQLVRPKILGVPAAKEVTADTTITGMLFRSEVVFGWPGLEILAYADTTQTTEIEKLRMDRLSPDIMLCLFNGVPKQIIVAEPKEGLRFGVVPGNQTTPYWIQPRFLGGNDSQPTGKPATQEPDQYATPVFRTNTGNRLVLDIDQTINHSGKGIIPSLQALNVVFDYQNDFHAAAFGVEMIYTAEEAIFTFDENKLPPPTEGCPNNPNQ